MNTILVIDHQPENVERMRNVLRDHDFQVLVAHRGDEGIMLAQLENPDAILLAFEMPRTSGYQILQQLKANHLTRDIPLLFTWHEDLSEEEVVRGLKLGAADYLMAPYRDRELVARVRLLVRLRQEQRRFREKEEQRRRLMERIDQGFFVASREGRFLDINPALWRRLGYSSAEEIKQIDIARDLYVNPEDRKTFQALIEKQGFVKDFKVDMKRKDGTIITVLLTGNTIRDDAGAVVGYEGFNVDITRQEREASAEEAELMRKLADGGEGGSRAKKLIAELVDRFRPQLEPFFSFKTTVELVAGKYEKVQELGIGRFGVVWKVRDVFALEANQYYVIKIPQTKDYNQRFLREGRILKKLEGHRAAIHLIEMVKYEEKLVLVQEFVEGEPLESRLERPMTEEQREAIVLELVDVVIFAHERDIIHRDIKPANILVKSDGSVKLLDFGIAKELKSDPYSGTSVGTKPFMAPEQIMGKSEKRSDLWALGVLMYQLYTGYLPFYDEIEKEMMEKILEAEPVLPREYNEKIDPAIEAVILKLLQKDPGRRPQSARELLVELKRIYEGRLFQETVVAEAEP
ncbi:MAG TPA: protein kinase [Anaeromyxobacteraceae bacterium]|nr:protein kinase [Anaeromyxobacteraceae bacterium]